MYLCCAVFPQVSHALLRLMQATCLNPWVCVDISSSLRFLHRRFLMHIFLELVVNPSIYNDRVIRYFSLSSVYTTTIVQHYVTVTPLYVSVMSSTTAHFNMPWNWTLDINTNAFMTVPIELVDAALSFRLD